MPGRLNAQGDAPAPSRRQEVEGTLPPCLAPQLTAIASFVDMVDLCSLLRRSSPAVAAVESVTSWSREWETQGPKDNNNILIIIRIVRMAGLEKNQLRIS